MLHQIQEFLPQIKQIIQNNSARNRNTIIGVVGGSCSVKSTVVAQTLQLCLNCDSKILHQDDYQQGFNFIEDIDPVYRWDSPKNYGIEQSALLLYQLKNQQSWEMPQYSFDEKKNIGTQKILPSTVIIFEGIYSGYGPILEELDFLIFVETPFHARFIRRVFRNSFKRYQLPPKMVLERLLEGGVYKAHRDLIQPQKINADVVVYNNFNFQQIIDEFDLQSITKYKKYTILQQISIPLNASMDIILLPNQNKYLVFSQNNNWHFKIPIQNESIQLLNYWNNNEVNELLFLI